VERASLVETHISVLFFFGDRVYKVRKPVTTPFLDFSTRELRLADCRREIALNRRLAPDVYLGVHDLVDESGAAVEHLVVMRRLPAQRRLAALIADPACDQTPLLAIARVLASFHSRAERSPAIDGAGDPAHLRMLWSTNLTETGAFADRFLDGALLHRVGRWALDYLAGRQRLFGLRVAQGRIVDGHGDLLAQDIFCLDDGPRILDCLEFADRFRWGDVLYDTAFLAMDLEHLGRADLAQRFLAAYREFSAETHPASLEHWYIAYRALVRAKIACLRAAAGDPTAAAEAAGFLAQSGRHLAQGQVRLVIVVGLPGTGKSTVATGLADRLGWELLCSDEVRKDLAGLGHAERAEAAPHQGLYTAQSRAAVYGELLRRAEVALGMGESVVLDATWLDPRQRAAARAVAERCRAGMDEVRCVLPLAAARERIRRRWAVGGSASDATAEVLDALAQQPAAPWPQARNVDTGRPAAVVIDEAVAVVRQED
jgi:aminoglycoside phosphotransferase family enzyme/predicted kinase